MGRRRGAVRRVRKKRLTAAELRAAGVSKERVVRLVRKRRPEPKDSEPKEERGEPTGRI